MDKWRELKKFVNSELTGLKISSRKSKSIWEENYNAGCELAFSHILRKMRKLENEMDGKIRARGPKIITKWDELKTYLVNEFEEVKNANGFKTECEQDFNDGKGLALTLVLQRMETLEGCNG